MSCNNTDDLTNLVLGKLKEEKKKELYKHIEGCPPCNSVLKTLKGMADEDALRAEEAEQAKARRRKLIARRHQKMLKEAEDKEDASTTSSEDSQSDPFDEVKDKLDI